MLEMYALLVVEVWFSRPNMPKMTPEGGHFGRSLPKIKYVHRNPGTNSLIIFFRQNGKRRSDEKNIQPCSVQLLQATQCGRKCC